MSVLTDQIRERAKWRGSYAKAIRRHDLLVAMLEYALLFFLLWFGVTYRDRIFRTCDMLKAAMCEQGSYRANRTPSKV